MDDPIKRKQPRKQNVFEEAGLFSQLFYGWSVPFLLSGFKRDLTDDDIREPMNLHRSDLCEREGKKAWADELDRAKRASRRPSLARALIRKYGPRYLTMCLIVLTNEVCSFLQVYFLYGLLSYFSGVRSTDYDAVYSASGVIILGFLKGILLQHVYLRSPFIAVSIKVAASTLIYQKVLKLSKAKKSKMSRGFIINLFASDANKLEGMFFMPVYLILSPLQCLVAGYFNWRLIGYAALPGAALSVCYYPVQWWLAGKTSFSHNEAAKKSDVRVRLMNEIISGIKVIKMYAWEAPFAKLVSAARKDELKTIGRGLAHRGAAYINFVYHGRVVLFITLMCYKILNGRIDAVTVYVVTALINIYQFSLSLMMVKSAINVGKALISLGRMTNFLVSDDRYDDDAKKGKEPAKDDAIEMNLNPTSSILSETDDGEIRISSMTASWSDDSDEPTLSDINIDFPKGKLSAIVGPVGSGKSSLLSAIIGEIPAKSGSIQVPQRLSYAAQEPWVFQGTIIDNIVFGQPVDDERYRFVLEVCGLDRDLASFPNGDRTIVGERGVMLSGGQKARVGLARAVYRKADVYLLDDPLSAVDVNVGKLIFEECVKGFLKGETVILVTHQIQFLDSVERIIRLENGKIKSIVTYNDLQEGRYQFSNKNDEDIDDSLVEDSGETQNTFSDMNSIQNKIEAITPQTLLKPAENIYVAYLKVNGGYWTTALVFILVIIYQFLGSFFDVWLKHWVHVEEHVIQSKANISHRLSNMDAPSVTWTPQIDSVTEICMIVLTVSIGSLVISAVCAVFSHVYFCKKVSTSLHNDMYNAVMRASMHFFNNSSSGGMLNRFSTELWLIDECLCEHGILCIVLGFSLIGSMLVVCIINPWLLIPFFFTVLICLGMKEIYLRTAQSFQRIESTSRSALLTHVNQTVEGLKTITAFGGQDFFTSEFHKHQDFHTAVSFSTAACLRAFGFWIDATGNLMMAVVIAGTFMMEGSLAGDAGLVITQVIAPSILFQLLLRVGMDFQNAMSSVKRVVEYAALPSEANWETEVESGALETWPREGKLHFDDVSVRYEQNGPKVLDNLNFTIVPQEKIGIIGRTGAGKSSLIQALFRLAEVEGKLEIDDVDTATIPLNTLRSNISIIPQDPLLFSGTLRKNLDPFDNYKDDELWDALEEVELKEVVTKMPNSLNAQISEGGGNLSVGQKQLVCLARALIRNNKILVLDEATANVDNETDAVIQKTIRRKFRANTVLTIAHRLHTVMDSDRVLVLSDGKVVEFDHPHVLFQDPDGHLSSLLRKCNKSTVATLRTLAEESYRTKFEEGMD